MREAGRIEKILQQMRSLSVVSNDRKQLKAHPILHEAANISADLFSKSNVEVVEEHKAGNDEIRVIATNSFKF